MLRFTPAVFAVGNEYQIMVPVTGHSLFRVRVGDRYFYDEQNGIMRSLCTVHRVAVPMELLDEAGQYTVCEREIIERTPYFPTSEEEVCREFDFRSVPDDGIRIYHIADAHNRVAEPVRSAEVFGEFDLLILNGDIPNHSGEIACLDTVYALAEQLTHGNIPIIFSRGNHDMRGYHAEEFADYTPNQNGHTYYSVRLGKVWALVLDCGEDKRDTSDEYGHTVACHDFRLRQTELIREVIRNADREYNAPGVEYKLVISHIPFTRCFEPPFDIEGDIYTEWVKLLKQIPPDLMLCGHTHKTVVSPIGGTLDTYGQPCTVVTGSGVGADFNIGCGLILDDGKIKGEFCNSNGEKKKFEI